MNKKGEVSLMGLLVEFIIAFFTLLAVGPLIHQITTNAPFGFVFQLIFPGPDDAIFGFIKAFVDSFILTGATGILFD